MKRIAVCLLLWTVSVWAVAQTSGTNPGNSNPAPQTYVIPAAPGSVSTNTGTAIIVAQPTAPLVVTPEMHLTTVNPSVGASNATPGNTAGAANATTSVPVSPRIVTTVPQFATAGASVTQTLPQESQPTAPAYNAAGGTISGTPLVVVNNGALFDRGVGSGNIVVGGGGDGESLGQIARQNRQHEVIASARVYTNSDIDRINAQPATGGVSGMAVGAGNETQQQPASNNPPAVAQPSPNPPPNPGVSQPVPPASTTPAPKEQSQEKQLPAGGSVLPLITAVGMLATGAGLLAK